MSHTIPERLYGLLPAIHRRMDAESGEPLRALMAILEHELEGIRADVDTTWDNWFVETCEEWVLPYIADMLGVPPLQPIEAFGFSARAFVANTLAYRRRKGTAAVLEQLARDVTGFSARVVEYHRRTSTTAHTRYVPNLQSQGLPAGTVDLRAPRPLAKIDGPFDEQAHTADVRRIAIGRGRHNLPNVGLHLWRVQAFEVNRSTARAIPAETGWFRFDPHGRDHALFNLPKTEQTITAIADETNIPHPLTRLELWRPASDPTPSPYLSPDPAFAVRVLSGGVESGPMPLEICNLADVPTGLPAHRPPSGVVAVDPELGRLVFALADVPPAALEPFEVLVDYAYGSAGDLGAGTFDRSAALDSQRDSDEPTWVRYVSRDPTLVAELGAAATLEDAVVDWNAHVAAAGSAEVGQIVVLGGRTWSGQPPIPRNGRTYDAPSTTVQVPDGARLYVVSANLGREDDGSGGVRDVIVPQGIRTPVLGDLRVTGGPATTEQPRDGGLFVNGISLEGRLIVEPGDLQTLSLVHCAIDASPVAIEVLGTNASLTIELLKVVCGGITAAGPTTGASVRSTVIVGSPLAIDLPGSDLRIDGSTIRGGTIGRTLHATSAIFDGELVIEQHQEGCLRFCFAPPMTQSPRRFRCQPDGALEGVTHPRRRAEIIAKVRPAYASLQFGAPEFALLREDVPIEIRTGGEAGAEMGAYADLHFPRRLANLRQMLRQYLRFGLEAGLLTES